MSRRWQGDDDEAFDFPDSGLSRRHLLRTAGAASLVLPAALSTRAEAAADEAAPPGKAARGRFFNAADLALVDALSETIIPTDEHSPGARAAGVAAEIDRRLAELPGFDPDTALRRRLWREGLRLVKASARQRHARPFGQCAEAEREAILGELARNERNPTTAGERFFVDLKEEVARAYYLSEIGLKQELEYKGNVPIEEYVGHDAGLVPLGPGPGPSGRSNKASGSK